MNILNHFEIRASEDSRIISGKAISFETPSTHMNCTEIISRSAITQALIDNSDILFTFNHDRSKVLARSTNGVGSLTVDLRDDGVYFSFSAPNTTLGDDVLEQIRRGDINKCSFAFTMARDNEHRIITRSADGMLTRRIIKIDTLNDLSAVFEPAYDDTYLMARSADIAADEKEIEEKSENEDMKDIEEKPEVKDEETRSDEEKNPDMKDEETCSDEKEMDDDSMEEETDDKEEETCSEGCGGKKDEETRSEDEAEKPEDKSDKTDEETREENTSCDEEKDEKRNKNTHINMEFRLIDTVNDILNGRSLNAAAAALNERGRAQMIESGLGATASFTMPYETRGAVTVAAEGEDVVQTDVWDVLAPLRKRNVLVAAGAKLMTGLVGDVQVPVMSETSCSWKGETAAADDGAGTFSHVTFSPLKLTAYVEVSRQFLMQASGNAEQVLRDDIMNAISDKLEATLLSADAKTATKPGGIFNGATVTDISSNVFAGIAAAEANVEEAGVFANCKYIISPKMKAALRTTQKGNGVGFVYENGAIDGTEALSTAHVANKTVAYGDWSNFAIASWGGISLTVDPYTKAKNDMVVPVVSAYFDGKPLRVGVFAFGDIK